MRRRRRPCRLPAARRSPPRPASIHPYPLDRHHDATHPDQRPASRHRPQDLRRREGPARHRAGPRRLLAGLRRHRPRPGAEECRAAGRARPAAGRDRRLARRAPRPDPRHGALPRLPAQDRLPRTRPGPGAGDDEECRCRAGAAGRPAARGADHQCALRAQRRQRALGQPVRRAVRHRCPERGRRLRARRRLQPEARRQGHRVRAPRARPLRTAEEGIAPRQHRLCGRRRGAAGHARGRADGGAEGPEAVSRPPGRRWRAVGRAAGAPRAAPGYPHRPQRCDRPRRPGRGVRRRRRGRAVDHPRPGGLGRGGRRRGQGPGLRQLARHPRRHADRGGQQGRADLHPAPCRGPRLHRRRARR